VDGKFAMFSGKLPSILASTSGEEGQLERLWGVSPLYFPGWMAVKHGAGPGYAAFAPAIPGARRLFWRTWRAETRMQFGKARSLWIFTVIFGRQLRY
jgi:hypothetical protein